MLYHILVKAPADTHSIDYLLNIHWEHI